MTDDYKYIQQKLPEPTQIGQNAYSATNISDTQPPNFPISSEGTTSAPFNSFPGGGGGGGVVPPPFDCDSSVSVGTLQTGAVVFPCDTPTSSISTAGISLNSDVSTTWLDVSQGAVNSDSGVIQLVELDVCHMGFPGKRQFVCGDSYAP